MSSKVNIEIEQTWTQSAQKLRSYLYCLCNRWSDADDLVQDCYMQALKQWDQYSCRGTREAWLFGIAKNTFASWCRKQKKSHASIDDIDVKEIAVTDNCNTVDKSEIWSMLNNLSEDHEQVILLKFAGQLSYAEIAEILEISIGTVRSRLHRALKKCRKEIGEKNEP